MPRLFFSLESFRLTQVRSTACTKCGLVSFATDEPLCRRCGAELELAGSTSSGPRPPQSGQDSSRSYQRPSPPGQDGGRSYTKFIVVGCVISLVLGVIAFGATADEAALALGLFGGVFVTGSLLSFVIGNHLKARDAPQVPRTRRHPTDNKGWKVLLFPVLIFFLLVPLLLLRQDANADQFAYALGQLTARCFFPAVITIIWINRSEQEWSWSGAALRYIILFAVFSTITSMGQRPLK